jgi:predicted nucleic-acid-binding protein
MIGLDTNVLVRYIVQDDLIQSGIATTFIETHCTAKTPGFVCNIVLVELVWVLERGYGYDKYSIITVLKQISATTELKVETSALVWQAILAYQDSSAGFADCLLAAINQQHECSATYTFDQNAAKMQGLSCLRRLKAKSLIVSTKDLNRELLSSKFDVIVRMTSHTRGNVMRINARLDKHSEKNLEFIKQVTGENITQIIKDLLEERAAKLRQTAKPGSKFNALLKSEFVGCSEGMEDLSTNYKDYIHQGLKEKHGLD